MTEIIYQIQVWTENGWKKHGWPFGTEEAAQKQFHLSLDGGFWKPGQLRIAKVTTITTTTTKILDS